MITEEQLLDIFAAYNPQIWPLQIVAYLLGIASVYLAVRKTAISERGIPAILAFFWLWVGLFFWLPSLLQGFVPGYLFTALFLIQGGLFLFYSLKPKLTFVLQNDVYAWAGIIIVLYALVGYPLVGSLVGHVYPRMSPFGLTPCPVVTFTFGLLLLAGRKVPKFALVIPLLFALSGLLWVSIGMGEDIGMVASGLLGTVLIWYRDSKLQLDQPVKVSATHSGGWSLDLPDKRSTP